jgi:hypothetical protein
MSDFTDTNHSLSQGAARRATRRRTGISGVMLGVAMLAIGVPVTAADPAAGWPDATTWAGWLEQHRQVEHAEEGTTDTGPGTDSWSRHLALEYPA